MTWLQHLINQLQSLEFGPWAAAAIAALFFLESAPVTGLLLPGIFLAVGLGSISNTGYMTYTDAILYASLGALIGDSAGYWIGYLGNGKGLFSKLRSSLETDHQKSTQLIHRYGVLAMFVGRFAWFIHPLVPVAAGIARIKPRLFYLADIPAVLLWVMFYSAFGHAIMHLARSGNSSATLSAFALLVLALVIAVYRSLSRKKDQ